MQYPFSFNDTYTDSYFTAYSFEEGMLTHEWGNITVTADAWGNIITPEDTYNNTLRVKSERIYTDSVWMSGIFIYATTVTQTDYAWYTATSHTSVIDSSVTGDGSSIGYRSDAVGVGEESAVPSQIKDYPNPASNQVNVEFPKEITSNTKIYIYNLLGKQVARFEKTGDNLFSADISTLAPGEYIIPIKSNAKNYTTTKFIKTIVTTQQVK